jgi:hypothetical protein
MVAVTPKSQVASAGSRFTSQVNRLAGRVRDFFAQHPNVQREEFLLDAVRREIDFLERAEQKPVAAGVGAGREKAGHWPMAHRPLRPEDVRAGAELAQRVAVLHYEKYGLWPRLRRRIFG